MSTLKIPGQTDRNHIVVLRALQLGDMLNAVPALRALRTAFPDAHITLVGLPWTKEFVQRFHAYLDHFISFPGFPGFPERTPNIVQFPLFLGEVQAHSFDLAIQMQGSGVLSNSLVSLFGAKRTAGFYLPGNYRPNEEYFLQYPQDEPEAWRHLRLMEFLGIPLQGDDLELPIFEQDRQKLEQIKETDSLRDEYICIHPGARAAFRRWAPENFAAVADGLADIGYQIVLTGTTEETELTDAVARKMKSPAIDLAGRTDLGTVAALVSGARLVLSNDTGMSHVAAALKTSSMVLFEAANSLRWAPQNRRLHKPVWRAMGVHADEVLALAKAHLDEINASSSEQRAENQPYEFDFTGTGGRK